MLTYLFPASVAVTVAFLIFCWFNPVGAQVIPAYPTDSCYIDPYTGNLICLSGTALPVPTATMAVPPGGRRYLPIVIR